MQPFPTEFRAPATPRVVRPASLIGVLLGIIMPAVAAWVYPGYFYWMPTPIWEWTRLQELPFVAAEALVIGWAMARGMELRHFTQRLPADCLAAIVIFAIGLWTSTVLVSAVPATSLTISLTFVIHLLFAGAVYFLLRDAGPDLVDDLGRGLTLGLIVLAALTAWKFLLPPLPSSQFMGAVVLEASLPGFISVRHFGSWTGAIAGLFAVLLLCRKDYESANWHDAAYLLSAGMTIWSGTRAAIVGIGLACLIVVIARRRMPSLRTIGRLCIITGLAATIAFLLLPPGEEVFRLFSSTDRYGSVDEATSLRGTLWSLTYAEWLKAPWFGWGSGATFWQVPFPNWHHTQPHNFVLQFLVSWGLVGASGAFWLLGRALIAVHRTARARPDVWPLVGGLYTLLIMACLEGMLHYPRFIMLIMVLFAAIFAIRDDGARGLLQGEAPTR